MTRAEIEAVYHVESGIVRSPGKFEGEPVWAVWAHTIMMDGCTDCDRNDNEYITLDAADRKTWPELKGCRRIYFGEDDNGFFWVNAR